MVYLPNELVNHIMMFRERHPLFIKMKYLIDYCYYKDYYPYKGEFYRKYSYDYSFVEWYFILIRLRRELNHPHFHLTPEIIML
jgi:hypothetical protein